MPRQAGWFQVHDLVDMGGEPQLQRLPSCRPLWESLWQARMGSKTLLRYSHDKGGTVHQRC